MAVRVMGVRHHGPFPNGLKTTKVSGSRYRLLHQVGGSRTPCHYHREKHPYLRVEKRHMQIRDSESLLITNTPAGKRIDRSHEQDTAEDHQNPAREGKGYLARRTAKRLMGISDDCKDTHRGDPVPTCIRSQCSHPSRDRPHQLSRTELHGGQKQRSYAPSARLNGRGPSNS